MARFAPRLAVLRLYLVGAAVSFLATVMLLSPNGTYAGHPLGGNASCWRSGTSRTCRYTWQYGQWMPLRLIDQVSPAYASWWDVVTSAMWVWNHPSAIGPQNFHYVPQSNDSWVYVKYAHTGQQGLGSQNWAMTWNYRTNGTRTNLIDDPVDIYWSEIYGNTYTMPGDWNVRSYIWAHEMGHTLGLGHHPGTLMAPAYYGILSPTEYDYGSYPPCSTYYDYSRYGIRCIYNWWWN